ncbi:hypothetical protein A1O3_08977 [Capronia epimyces CBS 606.96]|uniref:Zn(2)-C6 fungal-type domain-containing protein n=1 Tax=Capronia epimyces CBS 606.96 TaxID=1182542 RepID=W9XC56_9EURO|nr:uncharacterized protein A1O3_08977 [Capronia epimyces CBS 606.96]EXJ77818.1 hypothetical protein A1O3_08977 [Capronia epimyces CBS 606.96]
MGPMKRFYGRRKVPRSRSGCSACRQQKLKCNEAKPRCQRCIATGRECSYAVTLTWNVPLGAHGIEVERNGQPHEAPQGAAFFDTRSQVSFINTTFEDFRPLYSVTCRSSVPAEDIELPNHHHEAQDLSSLSQEEEDCPSLPAAAVNTLVTSPAFWVQVDGQALHLLEFYVYRMCPAFALRGNGDHGYGHIILPLASSSTLVLKCVLAVAASFLQLHSSHWRTTALESRGSALRQFADGCRPEWTKHLDAANSIIKATYLAEDVYHDNTVLSFIAQYFAEHNVRAYAALPTSDRGQYLLSNSLFWLEKIQNPTNEINPSIGCSTELMIITLEICRTIRTQAWSSDLLAAERQNWISSTQYRLDTLVQVVSSHSATREDYTDTQPLVNATTQLAEACWHAALILLGYLKSSPLDREFASSHVDHIINILDQMSWDETGQRASWVWPLFIAGCHATADQDRSSILRQFEKIEGARRFGHVPSVKKVVEWVWKQADLRTELPMTLVEIPSGGVGFVWDRAMAAVGQTLCLT